MVKVLFVCLGNICRSPAAEGVMKALLKKEGLEHKVHVESAGTSGYHVGELPDERMRKHAARRGYDLSSTAQHFTPEFFEKFDYIITMDNSNYRNVLKLDPKGKYANKVIKMSHLCEEHSITEVPDPYYGGDQGFEYVLDLVEDGCSALIRRLKSDKII